MGTIPPHLQSCDVLGSPQGLAEGEKWRRKREGAVWPLVACGKWPKGLVPSDWAGPPEPREEEGAPLGQGKPCHTSSPSSGVLGSFGAGANSSGNSAEHQSWGLSCHLSIINAALPLMSATVQKLSPCVSVQPCR